MASASIKRSISPSEKWHWIIILNSGQVWDVSPVSYFSLEECWQSFNAAGLSSLKQALIAEDNPDI